MTRVLCLIVDPMKPAKAMHIEPDVSRFELHVRGDIEVIPLDGRADAVIIANRDCLINSAEPNRLINGKGGKTLKTAIDGGARPICGRFIIIGKSTDPETGETLFCGLNPVQVNDLRRLMSTNLLIPNDLSDEDLGIMRQKFNFDAAGYVQGVPPIFPDGTPQAEIIAAYKHYPPDGGKE